MGLLDVLTGKRKLAKPAPDRLFAMSTAYVTFETSLDLITSRGTAAIVFQSLATADFRVDRQRHGGGREGHRGRQRHHGRDLRGRLTASAGWFSADQTSTTWWSGSTPCRSALEAGGYGERVLCAVFAFQDSQAPARVLDLQLQARLLLPVRARRRRPPAARQRARAGAQGPDRLRAAARARADALVPPVGDPDLSPPERPAPPILLNRRAATRPTITGVERWTAEIIPRLQALDPERYEVVQPRPRLQRAPRAQAWEQLLLPARAARRRAALHLLPRQPGPAGLAAQRRRGPRRGRRCAKPGAYSAAYRAWHR